MRAKYFYIAVVFLFAHQIMSMNDGDTFSPWNATIELPQFFNKTYLLELRERGRSDENARKEFIMRAVRAPGTETGIFDASLVDLDNLAALSFDEVLYVIGLGKERRAALSANQQRALVNQLNTAAGEGNREAMYLLGMIHSLGAFDGRPDQTLAMNYFWAAAKKGLAAAQFRLGTHYFDSDDEQAKFWLTCAADSGHGQAQYRLSLLLQKTPDLVGSALEKAFHYMSASAQQGDMRALYRLAEDFALSTDETCVCYAQAAKQGHADALKKLADLARTNQDALAQFYALAEYGLVEAQYLLASMYFAGSTPAQEKNLKEAFNWFYSAAKAGHTDAQFMLAQMLSEGLGTPKNEIFTERALKHARRAANAGHQGAQKLARDLSVKHFFDSKPQEPRYFNVSRKGQ